MQSDIVDRHLSDKQIHAVCKLYNQRRGIAYWKMGEGKTRIALALVPEEFPSVTLIVCRRKAFDTWRDEIQKVSDRRLFTVKEFPNPDGAPFVSQKRPTIWLCSHAMLHKIYNKLNDFYEQLNVIIYDELYLYSNYKSALSKSAVALRRSLSNTTRIYGLSGTIMSAGSVISIFSQSQVVGINNYIAGNLTDFYSKYLISFSINFGRGPVRQYKNKPNAFDLIKNKLQHYCDFYFPTSSDRQERSFDIQCDLSAQQKKYIAQLKKEYYLQDKAKNVEMELRSTLELVHRVCEISAGYTRTSDGKLCTFSSPKAETLCNKIEEILGAEAKCVVWCWYQSDIDYLKSILTVPVLEMSGRHEFDRKRWMDGKVSVVLATVGIGSSFNDFAQIEYAFYFSHSYKFLEMEQSKARSSRRDSRHSTSYYYHFTSRGTFDKRILDCARRSETTQKEFIAICQNTLASI